jgi:non-homologous end joining protein Ku
LRKARTPTRFISSPIRQGLAQRSLSGYQRGQFVTFTAEELKALGGESSKVIDLEKFVPRGDLDPVYFNSAYYLYPPIAVIGAAMAEVGVIGLGALR